MSTQIVCPVDKANEIQGPFTAPTNPTTGSIV